MIDRSGVAETTPLQLRFWQEALHNQTKPEREGRSQWRTLPSLYQPAGQPMLIGAMNERA